ncbi:SecDF P1 head subdomain-containing protein [Rhizobiales bacterium 3FA27D7]|jgi:hypothetical protein|uniref:SecDF P1 head subdomain-containing protein n=1 Tax=Mesorhizobium sp. 2RAF21 TaxID=3232995 RepID=UPI001484F81A
MPVRAIHRRRKSGFGLPGPFTLALACCLGLTPVGPIRAAESVTIPAYQPAVGAEHGYRIQKTTETDMSLWFDKPEASSVVMRGDFRHQLVVLSRDDKAMRVRWNLSADLPPGTTGAADSYAMNAQLRNSLAAYGVQQLDLDTDLTGYPTALTGADQIIAHMENLIATQGAAGTTLPADSVASQMLQAVKDNPLKVVDVLLPEVIVLSLGQATQEGTTEVGSTWTAKSDESMGDTLVPATSAWKFETTDSARRTATFSMKQSFDAMALHSAMKARIEKMIAAFAERSKQLTDEQMARVQSSQKSRDLTLVMSLQDGSTVEALDSVTVDTGGTKLTIVTHIWRDDQSPVLPEPPTWNAKSVSAQAISPLEQPASRPSDLEKTGSEAKPGIPIEQQAAAEPAKTVAPVSLKIAKAEVVTDSVSYGAAVKIDMTPDSAGAFRDFTTASVGRQTQLVVDGKVISEPIIREPITGGSVMISVDTATEAQSLARQLSAPGATITVRLAP